MMPVPSEQELITAGLKQMTMFSCLSDTDLIDLAKAARLVRFAPGASLMEEGSPGDCAYVILHGLTAVCRDRVQIASRGPGDCLGELAMLDSQERSASVRAETRVVAVQLQRETFDHLLQRPQFVKSLLLSLSSKLRESTEAQADSEVRREQLVESFKRFLDADDLSREEV